MKREQFVTPPHDAADGRSDYPKHYEALLEQIKRHEGRVVNGDGLHTAYACPAGYKTIGYGHNLDAHDLPLEAQRDMDDHDGEGISEEAAERLLGKTLAQIEEALNKAKASHSYWHNLSPVRLCVLINMQFNLGQEGLRKFRRMWAAIEDANFTIAAREMLTSRWAEQVGGRAEELAAQMETGEWQSPSPYCAANQAGFISTKVGLWIIAVLGGLLASFVV